MFRKLAVALVAALLPVLLFEIGLRASSLIDWRSQARAFARLGTEPAPQPGTRVGMAQLLRRSDNPRILYELRPGLSVVHKGRTVTTDARGFRVPETPAPSSDQAIRILGLGDSVMFGWGVAGAEVFLARLAQLLREHLPGSSWEAINTAVPGYNTVIEVETLLAKGLALEPDVVILSWVGNDLDLPNFLRPPPPALALDRSFLREWARLKLSGEPVDPFEGPTLLPGRSRASRAAARYLEALPPAQRALVGLDAFDRALDRLAEAAASNGFEILVVGSRGRMPRPIRRRFGRHGFTLVPTGAAIESWLDDAGLDRLLGSPLVLSPRDPHPSPLGHELTAVSLADHFVESGLARRLSEERARLD